MLFRSHKKNHINGLCSHLRGDVNKICNIVQLCTIIEKHELYAKRRTSMRRRCYATLVKYTYLVPVIMTALMCACCAKIDLSKKTYFMYLSRTNLAQCAFKVLYQFLKIVDFFTMHKHVVH